eukprot:jgi/Bigna1/92689/estExt_fgenesh1_pm.C_530005
MHCRRLWPILAPPRRAVLARRSLVWRQYPRLAFSSDALSWSELECLLQTKGGARFPPKDRVNGPTNSQATLRLFGKNEREVRVIFFRDKHAWCPYCQKIWIWLEEMEIPYKVDKVTMFCYGEKEDWYLDKVSSGMLPAVEIDGEVLTESDVILEALESKFGMLHRGMTDPAVLHCRKLERILFRAWCKWLCSPLSVHDSEDQHSLQQFEKAIATVESKISETSGPYMLEEFSTADVIFAPYIERMNASLYYYKGYTIRDPETRPKIASWFDAMEKRTAYRGTQSDVHTHVHDLPPQMGGCYSNTLCETIANQKKVDTGPWDMHLPDVGYVEDFEYSRVDAVHRVIRHRHSILAANPYGREITDIALRSTLTTMLSGKKCSIPLGSNTDRALRYIRDRISVPRDMSVHAARELRTALEKTASAIGTKAGPSIPVSHRRDQNPTLFQS